MNKKVFGLGLLVIAGATIVACGGTSSVTSATSFNPSNISNTWGDSFTTHVLADFEDNTTPTGFEKSGGWSNEGVFDYTYWDSENVKYADGKMTLQITDNPNGPVDRDDEDPDAGQKYFWLGAESRTTHHFDHGNFSVKMKPAKVPGTASTFFAYTGPSFDHDGDGTSDQWDEIDIEFLGSDTTKVQFNYFTNSEGGHEYMYDLGFDASEEYHEYGFRWEEDRIVWFVDGEAVYEATENIPVTPMRIFTNFWAGNDQAAGWMGEYNEDFENSICYYEEIGYADLEGNAYVPIEPDKPGVGGDTIVDYSKVVYGEAEKNLVWTDSTPEGGAYTIKNNTDGTYEFSHTAQPSDYENVRVEELPAAAATSNVLSMTVENKGGSTADIRVNINNDELYDATEGGTKGNVSINAEAVQDGEKVRTDTEWGGSYFQVESGETSTFQIYYDGGEENLTADFVEMMINSVDTGKKPNGNIVLKDVKFGTVEVEESEEVEEELGTPTPVDFTVPSDGNTSGLYTITEIENGINVQYTNITESWRNFNGPLAASAKHGQLEFKVKNNGAAQAMVVAEFIHYENWSTVKATKATVNGSAITVGGDGKVYLGAEVGTEYTIVMEYDDAANGVSNLQFFLDTTQDDGVARSGNIDLYDFVYTPYVAKA